MHMRSEWQAIPARLPHGRHGGKVSQPAPLPSPSTKPITVPNRKALHMVMSPFTTGATMLHVFARSFTEDSIAQSSGMIKAGAESTRALRQSLPITSVPVMLSGQQHLHKHEQSQLMRFKLEEDVAQGYWNFESEKQLCDTLWNSRVATPTCRLVGFDRSIHVWFSIDYARSK